MKSKVLGKVKWFNTEKGYGFIQAKEGEDIFFHYSQLMMKGFKTIQDGTRVSFILEEGNKGPIAKEIEEVM